MAECCESLGLKESFNGGRGSGYDSLSIHLRTMKGLCDARERSNIIQE